jgi:hypothetical protein
VQNIYLSINQKVVQGFMKMKNDCLPCIAQGSPDAARLATDDKKNEYRRRCRVKI